MQIIQQPTGQRLTVQTVQQLHQLVKQQQQQQPGVSIQQIIHTSSQPTIIATVPQSQPTAQMITKVLGAASSQNSTTQIQAISTGTPISVSHVTSHQPVATLNVATASHQTTGVLKPVTVSTVTAESVSQTGIQVTSVTPITQQSKLTAHNITGLQQIPTAAQVLQRSQPGVTVTVTPTQLHTSLVGQSVTTPVVAAIQRPTPTSTLSLTPTSLQTHTVGSNTPVTQMVVPSLSQATTPAPAKILTPQTQQTSQVFTTHSVSTSSPLTQTTQIQLTTPVATVVQTQGQSQTKTAPYAMRTRNTPKHT